LVPSARTEEPITERTGGWRGSDLGRWSGWQRAWQERGSPGAVVASSRA